jgi:hypothetical protein
MNNHIINLPVYKTNIISKAQTVDQHISYDGFDLEYHNMDVSIIRNKIYNIFDIDSNLNGKNVLLIDRDKPHNFYHTQAKIKGSGSSRRHIPNIDEIYEYLLSKNIAVQKVLLENLSLKEQIILFKTASIVIAQHGASLSNTIWCNPSTKIIEIKTQQNPRCFNKLMNMCNLQHKIVFQQHCFQNIRPETVYQAL